MSKNVSKLFKDWMIMNKSPNTANSYHSGVNTVSKHYERDVFGIDDLDVLEELYRLYGPKGPHADIGASNSNNVQNGLKQWLEYQRLLQADEAPSIDPVEGRRQWQAFLARWPVERLRALTLEHYYGEPSDDSFYSWMCDHTSAIGYFKEGPFSAGIRPLRGESKKTSSADTQSDDRYIWYSILGNSAQEAFDHLKAELLTAVEAVQLGDLSRMAGLKKAPGALVWKVAFLYQDQAHPLVLPFYTLKRLRWVAGADASGSLLVLQQQLISQRGEQHVLEFAAELERRAIKGQSIEAEKEPSNMGKPDIALNQILFGPPGTGKTYNTINQALAILAPEFLAQNSGNDPESRKRLKAEFDRFVTAERVRFVTFHQSFSYEDFVEGLRAENDEATGQLRYEVVDGVFKQMCQLQLTCPSSQANELPKLTQRILSFRFGSSGKHEADIASVIDGGLLELDRQDVKSGDLILVADGIQFLRAVGVVTHCSFPEEGKQTGRMEARVSWLKVLTPPTPLHEVVPNPSPVHQTYFLKSDRITLEALHGLLSEPGLMVNEIQVPEPKVLIIDEINRGNVSRIFGELITLIEPSKRSGPDEVEVLPVVLPYSKQLLYVPSNVYLIGTMNTADRSLAGLDIALRRRFVFKEMLPDHQLLKGVSVEDIDIGELLEVMNQRIEVLLDRDHCLGHAYFMSLKSGDPLERLESIFRNQILPLLQEYFFEDWQRIQWVLNDHRKPAADRFVEQFKPDLNDLFGSTVTGVQGGIWRVMPDAFKRASAFAGIIAVKPSVPAVTSDAAAGAESED